MINKELIDPNSIVIVGASNDQKKIGGRILKNIIADDYKGDLYAVNPKEKEVQGVRCFSSLDELPVGIDLAIVAVSVKYAKRVVEILAEKTKVKAFIILSAGFSEMGIEGKEIEDEIVKTVNKNGCSLIGPNCIGVLTTSYSGIFAGPVPKLNSRGCDFVSGSGATAAFIIEKGIEKGLTFASLFSVGNSAQITVEEVLKYWDETFDPETSSKVKIMYLENIDNPSMFVKHASSLIKKGCRVAAIKAGTSDAGERAASSHTGALATSDVAVSALFKKSGIIRCHGREELINVASILLHKELRGKNVAIVTHAGGPGVMLTDVLSNGGMDIPQLTGVHADELLKQLHPGSSVQNPIDCLATATAEQIGIIIDYLENKFDNIDAIAIIFGSAGLFDVSEVYQVIHEKMKTCRIPIYPILPSVQTAREEIIKFKSLDRIYFSDEVMLGEALTNVFNTAKPSEDVRLPDVDQNRIRNIINNVEDGYISSENICNLLDAVGISRANENVVLDFDSADKVAKELGFPLVMKVIGPVHKSDVGGVVLDVSSVEQVEKEFERLMKIDGAVSVLMQPMLSGTELFVGAKREGEFGHVILCGLGGIFIEVFKDTSAGLSPVGINEAKDMIASLKSYGIIKGARGQKGINETEFAEVITKLSALLEVAPEIAELDINPLLGTEKNIIAVDARIRIEK